MNSPSCRHHQQESHCCKAKTMCGRSLAQAVIIIGWTTVVLSTIILICSLTYLYVYKHRESPVNPVWGIMTITAMTVVCLAAYQIVISVLMLWQTMQKKPNYFFYSMWYVSHLSLLTFYCIIFIAVAVVHISHGYYVWGIAFFIIGSSYVVSFIYFEVLMNSYLDAPETEERFI